MDKETITIQAHIKAPVEEVWRLYTEPEHVQHWNNASEDWHTPRAENDLRVGGKFSYRMEAKEGGAGFDFFGTYNEVRTNQLIRYTLGDERKVTVAFSADQAETHLRLQFEAEETNTLELQRIGWQAILDNFRKYVEAQTNEHL